MNIFEESAVFKNFAQISKIPRRSGSEKAVSDYIASWAESLGLAVTQDDMSNLIIKKAASAGYEDRDTVALQAHMDMVCEKTPGSLHDFSKDPIQLMLDGDWLSADGTTLGADNGIGMAIAMSILESEDVSHPSLEVIFTVREETDFAGAMNIDSSKISAEKMINLDHACERELIVGSCGGMGVRLEMPINRLTKISAGYRAYKLNLRGLIGGHSGEDIHRGRGNAIALALRLAEYCKSPLVSIDGGTGRLAIPRDASIVVLSDNEDELNRAVKDALAKFQSEFPGETGILIDIEELEEADDPLDEGSLLSLRSLLRYYPNGIVRMYDTMEGIVESSDNIGIIETGQDYIRIESELRGGYQSSIDDMLETIEMLAALVGAKMESFAAYPPWTANNKSPLRSLALESYKNIYGDSMTPIAVHAGLECGIFAKAKPEMDIISIGPDCYNFHSPMERLSISSAIRTYDFLTELLSKI